MSLIYTPNYSNNNQANWKEDGSTPITAITLNKIENDGLGYITNNINQLINNIGNSKINNINDSYVNLEVDYKGLTSEIIADRIKAAIVYTRTQSNSYPYSAIDKIKMDFNQVATEGAETLPDLMKKFSYSIKGSFDPYYCRAFSSSGNTNPINSCLCEISADLVIMLDDSDGALWDDRKSISLDLLKGYDRGETNGNGYSGTRKLYIKWENGEEDYFVSSAYYSSPIYLSPTLTTFNNNDNAKREGNGYRIRIPIRLGYYFTGSYYYMEDKKEIFGHTSFTIDYSKESNIKYGACSTLISWKGATAEKSLESRVDKNNISVENIQIFPAYFRQPAKYFYTPQEFFETPISESEGE